MERKPCFEDCFICGDKCQFGPGIYTGRNIPTYNFVVCKHCYSFNDKGWQQQDESKIIKHLKDNKLPIPPRNSNGLYPRD